MIGVNTIENYNYVIIHLDMKFQTSLFYNKLNNHDLKQTSAKFEIQCEILKCIRSFTFCL